MSPLQRFRLGLLVLVCVMLLGTAGYMTIEGWSVVDALYMSVHTVTTVGMGEVKPLSPLGRLFTIFLILSGVTAGAYMAATFAEFVVGAQVREALGRRRMLKDLARLEN